jgi:hypothetical protein
MDGIAKSVRLEEELREAFKRRRYGGEAEYDPDFDLLDAAADMIGWLRMRSDSEDRQEAELLAIRLGIPLPVQKYSQHTCDKCGHTFREPIITKLFPTATEVLTEIKEGLILRNRIPSDGHNTK